MKIFDKTGKMALGSRLRLLSAGLSAEAAQIYALYGVKFSPKWFPAFFILAEEGEMTITEIAIAISHSQPSVSKIIREMTAAGLVLENGESPDKRRNVVSLTPQGIELAEKIRIQCGDVNAAIEKIQSQATHNLWEAIAEWEFLLEQQSLLERVREQKKLRESKDVQIVEYQPRYAKTFGALNEAWLTAYFEAPEASDHKALYSPEENIINKGGKIFVALYKNEPVGVCALIKMDDPDYEYEMAKMAVSPKAQGKSIGRMLARAVINAARESGASKLYLESNTILKAAINLYYSLGFQKIAGRPSPYKRCNIQMELNLNEK